LPACDSAAETRDAACCRLEGYLQLVQRGEVAGIIGENTTKAEVVEVETNDKLVALRVARDACPGLCRASEQAAACCGAEPVVQQALKGSKEVLAWHSNFSALDFRRVQFLSEHVTEKMTSTRSATQISSWRKRKSWHPA